MSKGLEVGFELDFEDLRLLSAKELDALRELLPDGQLPGPLMELRRRLERGQDAAAAKRLTL